MSVWREITGITEMNMRSLPQRAGTSFVVVVGIAGVVAVLISVLSLANGLTKTLSSTGRPERAIILYGGAQSEVESNISRDAVFIINNLPGIKKDGAGKPMVSADAMTSIWLPKRDDELGSLAFRGITANSLAVRPEIRLVEGRAFQPGLRELWVGKTAQTRFNGLELGRRVTSSDAEWLVVGIFESGGDAHESELLTDADTLLSASHRTTFNSVTAWLDSPSSFDTVKAGVTTNATLVLDVRHESEYYEQQSKRFATFLSIVANTIGVIMAIGAVFAALNTMHSAVSARSVEIATLRALGFGASGIVFSIFVEVFVLVIAGALIGSALAWMFFNGRSVSTISGGSSLAQVTFHLTVGFDLIAVGILWASAVGLIGGLFPAIRAARAPLAAALRGT